MEQKEKGYIATEIKNEFIKYLLEWSEKTIPKDIILQQEINGKLEGGNVLSEAHLTLFFGLNNRLVDKKIVNQLIDSIDLKELKIDGIKAFNIPQMKCKILYFSVDDKNSVLKNAHNKFLELPHFEEDQKPFIPHITIAYVKDSIDESSIFYDGPTNFPLKSIEYIKYE